MGEYGLGKAGEAGSTPARGSDFWVIGVMDKRTRLLPDEVRVQFLHDPLDRDTGNHIDIGTPMHYDTPRRGICPISSVVELQFRTLGMPIRFRHRALILRNSVTGNTAPSEGEDCGFDAYFLNYMTS